MGTKQTTTTSELDALNQDHQNGTIPEPKEPCLQCSEDGLAVPFDLSGDTALDSAQYGMSDGVVGIPWLWNNPYMPTEKQEKEDYLRESFLTRVLYQFSKLATLEEMVTFYAYINTEGLQFMDFAALREAALTDASELPREEQMAQMGVDFRHMRAFQLLCSQEKVSIRSFQRNFVFDGDAIYYSTHTYFDLAHYDLSRQELSGLYSAEKAAQELYDNFKSYVDSQIFWEKFWKTFWATTEVGLALLTFVPVVGQVSWALKGASVAARSMRLLAVGVNQLLAADAFVHGSAQLLLDKDISLGAELFGAIGKWADPVDGEERGRQAFHIFNLLLLGGMVAGRPAARWFLKKVPSKPGSANSATYELDELPTNRDGKPDETIPRAGEPATISSKTFYDGVTVENIPSHTSSAWYYVRETEVGRANVVLRAEDAKEMMALNIIDSGTLRASYVEEIRLAVAEGKSAGEISNIVGTLGERHIVETLIGKGIIKRQSFLGALENASGQGLDIVLKVPPPPTIRLRVPKTESSRNFIQNHTTKQPFEEISIDFHTGETVNLTTDRIIKEAGNRIEDGEGIFVLEAKSTNSGEKTPARSAAQRNGLKNVEDKVKKAKRKKGHWSENNQSPQNEVILEAIDEAKKRGALYTGHGQVFFSKTGEIDVRAGQNLGDDFDLSHSGIQLNADYNMP